MSTRSRTFSRRLAAEAIGAVVGATTSAGIALLLYTGQGFLRAAGLLFASSILALASGVWAGAPDSYSPPRSGARWVALVVSLLLGGVFTVLWTARGDLRELALGGALAVLLVLALPAYSAGALLAAIQARSGRRAIAAAALTGAAIGVLVTTMLAIQNFEPFVIYYAAAVLLLLLGIFEARAKPAAPLGVNHMNGKVAIVTGVGDRGQLGFTIAQKLLDAGARVVISGRGPHVETLAHELAPGHNVGAIVADLTNDDDVERLITTTASHFGQLDILINVAGGLSVIAPVAETTAEMWQQEIQRNAETVLRTSRAALPLLRASRGTIINFASPAGLRASPHLAAYSAAKAAVIALTRALAIEEKDNGIRVNAIAPGTMDTAQNRVSSDPDAVLVPRSEVADVVLFLASPAAAGVSGEVLHVLGATLS